MNNFDIKREEIKKKTKEIIQSDKKDLFLTKFDQNYSKDKKELLSKEEFFKEKEKIK